MPAQPALVHRRVALPPWLPASVRARLAGQPAHSDRLPPSAHLVPGSARRRLRTPTPCTVAEWAAKHRRVTDGAHVGQWRHEYAPHTVRIMDTFGLPWVREVWFLGVEQSGKTNSMLNCLAWAIEQAPGNMFYVMPSEDTVKKMVSGRLRPLLTDSPRLATHLTGRADDLALDQLRLDGLTIFPAHANSAAAMASWSARHVFADEVDKYPELTGKETSPIELIRKRTRTYRGRFKRFFASTPAGRFIHKNTYDCHQVHQYRLRCPHCQELIRPEAAHLDLAKDATPEQVERDGCVLACHQCGGLIDEAMRQRAIRTGAWIAVKGGDLARPARVGFHHRAWDCLDISLREIAAAYLRATAPGASLADKIAWANGYEAIDYEHVQQDRKEEFILRLRDEAMPRGVVPEWACCLLMIADTQKRGFHYATWAVGYGPECPCHLVEHGFVERFAHLADLGAKTWTAPSGRRVPVLRGYIDSGGGTDPHHRKHSRTTAVYEFCRRNRTWRPVKGNTRQDQVWNSRQIDFYPTLSGKKVPVANGPTLYMLQVNHFKDELADKLQIEPGDPGGITLHAGVGDDYARQLCAEYSDESGRWVCPRGRDNHQWDNGVYLRAAITIEGLLNARPVAPARPRPVVHSKGARL